MHRDVTIQHPKSFQILTDLIVPEPEGRLALSALQGDWHGLPRMLFLVGHTERVSELFEARRLNDAVLLQVRDDSREAVRILRGLGIEAQYEEHPYCTCVLRT